MQDSQITLPGFTTRYDEIIDQIAQIDPLAYAATRNYTDGAVTRLSPYISRGVISVRQIQEAVLQKGYQLPEIEKFVQELAWREYYQRVWQAKKSAIKEDLKQKQPDVLHYRMITAIEQAATGISSIDNAICQLYETGYMHNHIRMYTAAVTCNMARAHWKEPARWLYYHLLDGDVASNHCSWQWVAAAFSSKKYYCNQENINRYTKSNQYHTFLDAPYESLPDMPVPEVLKEYAELKLSTHLPATPLPEIDITKPTLLYNAYNLDPLWRKNENCNRILLLEPSHYAQYPVSKKVIDFIMSLSENINGLQVFCGEIDELTELYQKASIKPEEAFISKEHPAFGHYPGRKDPRDWLYPTVTGYYPSFFSFWKECKRSWELK